jgi:hypothetical protein
MPQLQLPDGCLHDLDVTKSSVPIANNCLPCTACGIARSTIIYGNLRQCKCISKKLQHWCTFVLYYAIAPLPTTDNHIQFGSNVRAVLEHAPVRCSTIQATTHSYLGDGRHGRYFSVPRLPGHPIR